MEKIVHILTVGTSLLTNTGGARRDTSYQERISQLNRLCEQILREAPSYNSQKLISGFKNDLLRELQGICLNKEIGFRPPQHGKTDRMPQELSYLRIHMEKHRDEPKAECYLLTSDTNIGILCGEVIMEYVNSHCKLKDKFEVVSCEKIEGVDDTRGKDFKDKGFRNLIDKINKIIDEVENKVDKIYLNITGGYKGLVPYSTLQAMIRSDKVTLCYLFENSPEIIEMPIYPVGLDFHLWHRNATRLRMTLDPRAGSYFKPYLHPKIKNLIYEENGQPKLFSLGKCLERQYKNQREQDPIKVYSKEIIRNLLPDELRDEAIKLRGILEKLVDRVGDLIWVGDKIPEEVDHALKHHHNLLEFAELFLLPILSVDQNYLNVKERFCLIASILLHDCGHSLDYMDTKSFGKVPLFPSEIRELHHFLSYQRLNDPETAKELKWPGREGFKCQGLDENLHDAVLTVCLYHRKRMGYIQKGKHPRNPFTEEEFPSLKDFISQKSFNDIDLMKVVALMRLIDGCDIQARRAGSKEEVEITRKLLERDYQTALKRAIRAVELWLKEFEASNNCLKSTFSPVNLAIRIKKDSNGKITTVTLEDEDRKAHVLCLKKLEYGSEDEKRVARLWLIAAELIDKAGMIKEQERHYLKHQCVKEVRVIPSGSFNNGNLSFEIRLIENPNVDYLEKPWDDERKFRQVIEEEISGEYKSIKDYSSHKLSIIYKWNDGDPFYPLRDNP